MIVDPIKKIVYDEAECFCCSGAFAPVANITEDIKNYYRINK